MPNSIESEGSFVVAPEITEKILASMNYLEEHNIPPTDEIMSLLNELKDLAMVHNLTCGTSYRYLHDFSAIRMREIAKEVLRTLNFMKEQVSHAQTDPVNTVDSSASDRLPEYDSSSDSVNNNAASTVRYDSHE